MNRLTPFIAATKMAQASGLGSPLKDAQEARERSQSSKNEFQRLTASKAIVELEINRDAANLRRLAVQIDCALRELGHGGIHSLPDIGGQK